MCSTAELVTTVGSALTRLDEPAAGVGDTLADDYVALRRLVDQLEVVGMRWLATLDGSGIGAVDGSASTAAWVRRHTRCSARSAAADVRLARRLHSDDLRPLTTTAELLETGRLTLDHARVLARATATLDPEAFDLAEAIVAEAATTLGVDPAGQVAAAVCEQVAEVHAAGQDDPAAARRAAADAGRRRPHLSRCGDHYALDALLTVEAGQALQAVLDPLSAPRPEADGLPDLRTAAQRRADALGEAARQLLTAGRLLTHGGQRPQLTVLVDLDTLATGRGAGRFADGGRVSPAATERLGCDALVSWVATTSAPPESAVPAGDLVRRVLRQVAPALGGLPTQVLDAGRARRLVSPAQRRVLTHRDRGCVFPGCDRPPAWCDAHHLVHWARGGATDLANLVLLCPRHHTTVHDDGWTLTRAPDGAVTADPPP